MNDSTVALRMTLHFSQDLYMCIRSLDSIEDTARPYYGKIVTATVRLDTV